MKQQGFADLFPNMNRFKISSYVNETSKPSVEFMIILKRLTGIDIELLYFAELDKKSIPKAPLIENMVTDLKEAYVSAYQPPQTLPELFERVKSLEKEMLTMREELDLLQKS